MNDKKHIIFSKGDCPDKQVFYDYLEGNLNPDDYREFELHMADCEMCSDMLEGIELTGTKTEAEEIIGELKTKIFEQSNKKIKTLFIYDKRWQYMAAAVFLVLLVSYFVLNSNFSQKEESLITQSQNSEQSSIAQHVDTEVGDENIAAAKEETEIAPIMDTEQSKERSDYKVTTKTISSENEQNVLSGVARIDVVEETISDELELVVSDFDADYNVEFNNVESDVNIGNFYFNDSQNANRVNQPVVSEKPEMQKAKQKSTELESEDGFTSGLFSKRKANKSVSFAENEVEEKKDENLSGGIVSTTKSATGSSNDRLKANDVLDETTVLEDVAEEGRKERESSGEETAIELYRKSKYNDAISEFNTILKDSPNNYTALYYSSLSLMAIGNQDNAKKNLLKIIADNNNPYQIHSKYQLARIYIEQKNILEAKKLLQEVIEFGGVYKDEAINLMEKLD